MTAFNVRFAASPPDGWVSMVPADVGYPEASVVYLRQADQGSRLVTNISVTEHLLMIDSVDLETAGGRYVDHLRSRVHNLRVTRSDYISFTAPLEFGQQFEFVLELDDVLLPVHQSRICIALPLTYSSTLIEEIVFTTAQEKSRDTNGEFVKFLESLEIIGDQS